MEKNVAKKSASGKSFNMAAEIREQLNQNKDASGPDIYRALQKKFPGQSINENSCLAAVSGARKGLGISRRRRSVRRKKPSAQQRGGGGALDMATLQAARRFVSQVGSVEEAIAAVQTIKALQVD